MSRLECVLNSTSGKVRRAVEVLITLLGSHSSQTTDRWEYTELSVGYLSRAADVGWETARTAWHLVRERVGWFSVSIHRVRQMGVHIRERVPGGKWGQHLLTPLGTRQVLRDVSEGWELSGPQERPGDPSGWVQVHPVTRGRNRMCPCPFHEDRTPSMILNMNPDGRSGSAVCFRCVDPRDGGHLRGFWREVEGVTRVRLSRGVRSSVTPSPSVSPGIGTIEKPTHRGPGSWVLCHRTPHGMSRRGSRCGDLLDVLRVSDTRSQSDRVWGQAVVDHHEGREVGDRLVSLNRMVPVEWKIVRTRRGSFRSPTRWEVTGTRWVMCDLDGFTDGPVGDGELELGGLDLERWAESHPLLTGRVGIVRTSHLGVQMVVELREVKDPRRWWRTREGITFTEELDRVGMEITHAAGFAGGHPDQSVHNGGRLMRRPGWRVDKRGDLTRSRLVFAS